MKNDTEKPSPPVEKYTPGQERFGRWLIRKICRVQKLLYRISGGKLASTFNGGQVALLTFTGRKTGRQRVIPLVFAHDGENVIMAASQGGMSKHPMWYHSLVANPDVSVQIGPDVRDMRCEVVDDAREEGLWEKLQAAYPDFAEYRERAALVARKIPLLLFTPR